MLWSYPEREERSPSTDESPAERRDWTSCLTQPFFYALDYFKAEAPIQGETSQRERR